MADPIYRVYVIELDDSLRKGTEKRAVYVGYSAKTPEERFAQHLRGERASRHVRDHGVRLRPCCTSRFRSRRADPKPKCWSDTWRTGSGVEGSRSTAVIDGRPDRQVVVG